MSISTWFRSWFTRKPPAPVTPPPPPAPPNWTLPIAPLWLKLAAAELGFREVPGNRGIEKYIELAGIGKIGDPWCAIFANAMLQEAGIDGSHSDMARSFETAPNFVNLGGPALGCIVTMWRDSPTSGLGHVGFYTGENAKGIWIISGNDADGVREDPFDRKRITGYFWPKSQPFPIVGPITHG